MLDIFTGIIISRAKKGAIFDKTIFKSLVGIIPILYSKTNSLTVIMILTKVEYHHHLQNEGMI